MRIVAISVVAALVVACSPAEETDIMSAGCDARGVWSASDGSYSAEATTSGPDCARAVATIVIRDSSGVPIFTEAHLTAHLMTLAPVQDAAAMQTALNEWVTPSDPQTSNELPEWLANAEYPVSGEFPFYPAEGVDRAGYEQIRAANAPTYCYVQGMESLNCVVIEPGGGAASVGVQSFPG